MKTEEAAFTRQLEGLLAELPLDTEQRESVAANLIALPEAEARALSERLSATLSSLQNTIQEINDVMATSQIRVTTNTTLEKVFALSSYEPA